LTRAIYILCIEHLKMLPNPGPPALQANTLCKEPFERRIELPFGITDCSATAPPQVAMGIVAECDSVACSVRVEIRPNACRCMRIAHLHLHPLHRASENVASQRGIEPGTSCTAGEHSMLRAIRTAYRVAIRDLSLCCYSNI
jgi:hypothetical protein